MSEPKPNWVARQAACQTDVVFEDLLKVVQQDVDAMNALPKDVALSWDMETPSCGLIWDGKEDRLLEVWQVSQKALAPLFFDTGDDEV